MDISREPVPVVVALANAGRAKRPPGARVAQPDEGFSSLGSASATLKPLLPERRVTASDLPALRELAQALTEITSALIGGESPRRLDALNRIAAQASATRLLRADGEGGLQSVLEWKPAPPAAELARAAIEELGRLDPARLRVCARPECSLLFYDTTRPNTQRWHSDAPCGWRERQRRRRSSAPHRQPPESNGGPE
jgi:predicted RNA-binding Zn ribbon-like protein